MKAPRFGIIWEDKVGEPEQHTAVVVENGLIEVLRMDVFFDGGQSRSERMLQTVLRALNAEVAS